MLKVYQLRLNQNTFEVTLKYKGVGVRVAFVDGNTYNGTPAKCYTNDPFKQRAIEASQMFQDKDIVLERAVPEASDMVQQPKKENKVTQQPASPEVTEPADAAPVGDGSETKEFDNLGEAIMFIAQNYQMGVQSEADARKVLKEHGINPIIHKSK